MKATFGFAIAATMVLGGAPSAEILYHNPVGSGNAADQEFGDFPTYSTYLVADFTVLNPGFKLTSVVAPMTINGAWCAIKTARLTLFPKVGSLPVGGDAPAAAIIVPVFYNVDTGVLSTVGLSLFVPAGDYWIGLTAIGDFGVVGQAFHLGGQDVNGDTDAYRNPGGSFGFPAGTDWGPLTDWATVVDIALTVEGGLGPPECPWDLDGDSHVGASDLLSLLAAWGPNPCHLADFDRDGTVGASDLLALLANWGPCP